MTEPQTELNLPSLREALEQTTEALIVARGQDARRIEPDPFAYDNRPITYHGDRGHGEADACAKCDYEDAFDVLIEMNRALLDESAE